MTHRFLFFYMILLLVPGILCAEYDQEQNQMLQSLIVKYYQYVEQEDIASLSDLMFYDSMADRQAMQLQQSAVFSAVDMTFPSVNITDVAISTEGGWATVNVSLESEIRFMDTKEVTKEENSRFVLLAIQKGQEWKIAKCDA